MSGSKNLRDWGGRSWTDHGQFYQEIYAVGIQSHHRFGRVGASLIPHTGMAPAAWRRERGTAMARTECDPVLRARHD